MELSNDIKVDTILEKSILNISEIAICYFFYNRLSYTSFMSNTRICNIQTQINVIFLGIKDSEYITKYLKK